MQPRSEINASEPSEQVESVVLPLWHHLVFVQSYTSIHLPQTVHSNANRLLPWVPSFQTHSRSLNPNTLLPRPQKAAITLLIRSPSTKAQSNPRGPCPPLEQQYREHNAERETERGADQEGRETAIPLHRIPISLTLQLPFSFLSNPKSEFPSWR